MTTLAPTTNSHSANAPPTTSLIYAGIDEAGYGPRLGPLCVAMAVLRIDGWTPQDQAPDLWGLLSRAVSRDQADARHGRIAVADSKKLKKPNSSKSVHPLSALELGVLAFLQCTDSRIPAIERDDQVLARLDCDLGELPDWYQGEPQSAPVSTSREMIGLRAASLGRVLTGAGAAPLDLRCMVVGEDRFNRAITHDEKAKSDISFEAVGRLIRSVFDLVEPAEDDWGAPRVVIDRQGGRTHYARELERVVPGARVTPTHECPEMSRYLMEMPAPSGDSKRRKRLILSTRVQAEDAHLPVALASMIAKYVRELLMTRFNAYWSARCAGIESLKPTAGYGLDAKRWLNQVAEHLIPGEREQLWRRR